MRGLADAAACARRNDWSAMDEALHQWLAGHATDAWVRPVVGFTQLGHVGWMMGLAALAVALGVGASRVVLRVHFASDVLAGWLLGLAWMALVVCAVEWARSRAQAGASARAQVPD